MLIDAAQLCLNQDDFLRTALPFVCCFVSVLYRHRGLALSSTRYSKCMNLFPKHLSFTTGRFHSWVQIRVCSQRSGDLLLWCSVCFPCSWAVARSLGHLVLWKT